MPENRNRGADPVPVTALGLRPMAPQDLDQILEIERASFGSPWTREYFLHEIRESRVAVASVIELCGRVAAYACVRHLHGELKINNIAVAPASRRRGLGRWLMEQLFSQAVVAGCRTVDLEVRPSNLAAIALYRDLGLIEIGRRRDYYPRETEDAVLMQGDLPRPRGKAPFDAC